MRTAEALKIVQALADGIDPNTGEIFPEESAYQHPQVVRALLQAVSALQRLERAARAAKLPPRAGKPWDEAEDAQLSHAFDAGQNIAQLARRHGRTRGAIEARLARLGKLPVSRPFQRGLR